MSDELFERIKTKYNESLKKDFEKHNYYRKACRWLVGLLIGIVMLAVFFVLFENFLLLLLPLGLMIVSIFQAIYYGRKGSEGTLFNEYYMKTVIQEILLELFTDVDCYTLFENPDLEEEIGEIYNESGFDKSYEIIRCYSEINMKHNDYDLAVYDIHTLKENTDSNGNTTTVTTFKGLYGIMDIKYDFNGEIHVNKRGLNYNKLERVNIDSVTFGKEFKVLASDKVLAMQLLTHDVMDKLIEIVNSIGNIKFEFRIINDKMYFRIFSYNTWNHDGKELFDRKEVDNDYINAKLIRDIVDTVGKSITDNGINQ